MQMIWVGVSRL